MNQVIWPCLLAGTLCPGLLGCKEPEDCQAGTRRHRNGCVVVKSDPDGSIDDGGGSTTHPDGSDFSGACLVDMDHDGFGVEGAMGSCPDGSVLDVQPGDCDDDDERRFPGAPIDRCDGKDNDCDGKDEPPLQETCNGQDDDCKDGIDNGVVNACGMCGELPAETCNGLDDDCDGVADPNLFESIADDAVVHVQPGISEANYVQLSLQPRGGGGAWLIYRGDIPLDTGHEIQVRALDTVGQPDAKTPQFSIGDSTKFVAASDGGKWIALLVRTKEPPEKKRGDSVSLTLKLFNAKDMSLVRQQEIVTYYDNDEDVGDRNDEDDCDDVQPLDVGVAEDKDGDVHFAVGYVNRPGTFSGSACAYNQADRYELITVTYTRAGAWDVGPVEDLGAVSTAAGSPLLIERVPCREEWFVLFRAHNSQVSRAYDYLGAMVSPQLDSSFGPGTFVTEVAPVTTECNAATATMLVGYHQNPSGNTPARDAIRTWTISLADGSVARAGDDISLVQGTKAKRILASNGRAFVVGSLDYQVRLWEVALSGAGGGALRDVPVFGGSVRPGDYGVEPERVAVDLVETQASIIFAARNSFTADSTLDDHRGPGVTDPAVAVTYRLGCAE